MLGDVIGEDGLHTVGNMGKGELLKLSLKHGISGKLVDHVVGNGREEFLYLLGCGDGQFTE